VLLPNLEFVEERYPGSRLRFTKRVAEAIRRSSIELYESTCDPEAILSKKR